MKKSTSIRLLTQFNQKVEENNAEDDDYYLHELNFNQQKNFRKKSFRKYYTSDLAFILGEKDNKEDLNSLTNERNANSLKDVAKIIHQQFIQSSSPRLIEQRLVVPDFIRQRDQQKKEMIKIIKYNEEEKTTQKNTNKYQAYFVEIILIMAIIMMWKKIFENLKLL